MKKTSLLLSLLTLFVFSFLNASALDKEQMVKEWERAKAYTKLYLETMPDDGYDFKPSPDIRSFAQQLLHLADANYNFAALASGIKSPVERGASEKSEDKSKAATTKMVLDSYDFVINALKGMTDEQMKEMVKFGNRGDMSKEMVFAKAFEHQTHHRGQTTIYIRMKGIKPPNEMLF
ncbi:DinB family protein [Emticicia sp. BO119]|uniref:DinB family protein n=1 Tax=Emticicia sp. BO119 TaxID=2757768 RepID=UPI0015F095FA|nr:DinB family protein [Emticicia sp. BO119]MBA4852452.1 DinB family protein [Emticicia sp. BO119]